MTDHISDLRWDRWLAGELSADDTAAALAHADHCARCGDRMRALSAERERFATPFPRPRRRSWIAAPILAAAAVLVLVLRPSTDGERTKGSSGPSLILAGGARGAMLALEQGDAIHPGDSLQAAYTSDRDGFGAVISRDGAGTVTTYVPSRGTMLAPLPAGTHEFPESTILDAVVGTETIDLIWCPTARPIAAPTSDCTRRTLVLEKRP